jgi:hypothetical protein
MAQAAAAAADHLHVQEGCMRSSEIRLERELHTQLQKAQAAAAADDHLHVQEGMRGNY